MNKITDKKNIFKYIAISGICGLFSLIFDQLAIQEETSIREISELTQESINKRSYSRSMNRSLLGRSKGLSDLIDNSFITLRYLYDLDSQALELKLSGEDYQKAEADVFELKTSLEKNIRRHIDNTSDFYKLNSLYYGQLELLNDESREILETIMNKDYYLDQVWVLLEPEPLLSEVSFGDVLLNLRSIMNEIDELITYSISITDENEPLYLVLEGSLSTSVKQRYLLLGTIFQILSLMFLIVFFRSFLLDERSSK
jgi:hypothetical protein